MKTASSDVSASIVSCSLDLNRVIFTIKIMIECIFFFMYSSRVSCFFFSSRRRHTRLQGDWSSDVCSSDLAEQFGVAPIPQLHRVLARVWPPLQREPHAPGGERSIAAQLGRRTFIS